MSQKGKRVKKVICGQCQESTTSKQVHNALANGGRHKRHRGFILMGAMLIVIGLATWSMSACAKVTPIPMPTVMVVTAHPRPTATLPPTSKTSTWLRAEDGIPAMSGIVGALRSANIEYQTVESFLVGPTTGTITTIWLDKTPDGTHALRLEVSLNAASVPVELGAVYVLVLQYDQGYYLYPIFVVNEITSEGVWVERIKTSRPLPLQPSDVPQPQG